MTSISELQQALRGLSAADLESIADWLEVQVEESRHRTHPVREAQPEYSPEEPLFMTWEEYLAFEERSPYRHEYVNGSVYALRCESLAHNSIAQALLVQIKPHLHGSPCQPYFLQAKFEIRIGSDEIMYYPDVMISCHPQDLEDQVVRNPKLVVEILSQSTRHIDRREKALTYQRVEAVEEYALVEQDRPRIIVHRKTEGWRPMPYADTAVEFRSIGLSIPLEEIYERGRLGYEVDSSACCENTRPSR